MDKALGGFYRRLKGRRGGLVANQALARKLAALFWRLMVRGMGYVEEGLKKYETRVAHTEQWLLHVNLRVKSSQRFAGQMQPPWGGGVHSRLRFGGKGWRAG